MEKWWEIRPGEYYKGLYKLSQYKFGILIEESKNKNQKDLGHH